MSQPSNASSSDVVRFRDSDRAALASLLGRYGLSLCEVSEGEPIPGSFWGDEEAGLAGDVLTVRGDTPVHSILHEACHYICMDGERRAGLDTNAGGDCDEENAVCYLQIVLAEHMPGFDGVRMMADMDAWGYSFRLGSARNWFKQDAADARDWLQRFGLLNADQEPTFAKRT